MMTNVKISKKIKRGIKIALLSATIFTMGGGAASSLVTRADDNSPIIYNGNNPKQDPVIYKSTPDQDLGYDNNIEHDLYLTSGDNQTSNYAQINNGTPNSAAQPSANSLIDADQFEKANSTQNSTSLVAHLNLINPGTFSAIHHRMYLPLHWKQYQTTPNSPDVVASGAPILNFKGFKPDDSDFNWKTYIKGNFDLTYHYSNGDDVAFSDTAKIASENAGQLEWIDFYGLLWSTSAIDISVPLYVNNLDKVNTANSNGTFTISSNSLTNLKYNDFYNLNVRFAKQLTQNDINNKLGVGKQYLITTRNNKYKYTQASDIQSLMPNINPIGNPNEITIDNLGTGENDTTYYSGYHFYLDPTKMSNATNGQSVLEMLNNNGYMMPYQLDKFRWGSSYNLNNPNPVVDPDDALNKLNKGNIGGVVFQAVKVLDPTNLNTIDYGAKFNPMDYIKVNDPTAWYQTDTPMTLADAVKAGFTYNSVDTKVPGQHKVTFTMPVIQEGKTVNVTRTITINVKSPAPTPGGGGSITNNSTTNTNTSGNQVGNGGFDRTDSTTTQNPAVPNYAAKEGAAVYATKGIYLYKNANFKKSQRVAKYTKAKRVNRPMFVVTGYKRAANGALRYKVRDVNHGTKNVGKTGYITANRKFVVRVYYSSMPKNKKITVINKKGVNVYKNANLTKRVKNYKKGTRLTVKKIVKHNLTSRYQLSNGYYITANKKLIIQGNY
ncbi:DUF5776 domain-containing protein [Lentilactobacillus kisonensis]|uniref:DUF5776 domain-containing protein n=1 Tax=Lentilactobacillus kisonensis F0435 TaxID=797516 RepID=H1LCC4_9LACO|nr:DUF5776 domain-containing protein [Lentilactobacillus kisonensis]EHO54114.1 hypothetical protein HMPREF9104_00237 [Lentilactobacillus kisonensis F0435]